MEGEKQERLDESFYRDSQWIAGNGGFLHENNGDAENIPANAFKISNPLQSSSILHSHRSLTDNPTITLSSPRPTVILASPVGFRPEQTSRDSFAELLVLSMSLSMIL